MNNNYQLFTVFCILDILMPDKDGFIVLQEIRKLDSDIPVIFLTAKTGKEDRIKGFKLGCDDYLTKPFSTEELALRIEAILRRTRRFKDEANPLYEEKIYKFGDLLISQEYLPTTGDVCLPLLM